ncbi:MAG: tRNA 2-selenouridine(34) synthase MnmH [Lewinellaceae bacterium]|nr:tRNA 2-selenouridine(34) synthase MnmH [Lewinellaceae bacterium]
MDQVVDTLELLAMMDERVLLDVRSPGEYAQGHIPGAFSFPLFSDEERARVGTTYKQANPEAALLLGLDLVGPKMGHFVVEALKLSRNKKLAVHCWRGGQRSKSMAWLLRLAGCDVVTLNGGYKAFRHEALDQYHLHPYNLRVVGGRTGSGKTKVLQALRDMGEQIIDLEGLAHHKGSAFGAIGEQEQPSVEQFENDLFFALRALDPQKRIWIENESRSIGRVYIPTGFGTK